MKRIRATISILTFAAASSLMTDALAFDCRTYNGQPTGAPFMIGFEANRPGTHLKAVIYPVLKIVDKVPVLGEAIDLRDEKLLKKFEMQIIGGPFKINGARCADKQISVNRYWNHELFYLIDIGWGPSIKYDIPHGDHPHDPW